MSIPVTDSNSQQETYVTGIKITNRVLSQLEGLDSESNGLIRLNEFRNDPRFSHIDGTGQTVVVLDTGINLDHPAFGPDSNGDGISDRIIYSYDFADGDSNASDFNGHGSNVAAIAAGYDPNNNYSGIAPGADIIALKVFTNTGTGTYGIIEDALRWVIDHSDKNPFATGETTYDFTAINMSLSDNQNWTTETRKYAIDDELNYLANFLETIPVSAAGNYYAIRGEVEGVGYPAADPNSLAVSSVFDSNQGSLSGNFATSFTSDADRIVAYSQRSQTDNLTTVMAPGARVTGAAHNSNGFNNFHGTSQAAPQVTGAILLAQQLAEETLGRRLTMTEIENLLNTSGVTIIDGDDEDDNVFNTGKNWKRIDMFSLGEAILSMSGVQDPLPTITINTPLVIGEAQGNRTITVSLSQAYSQNVTVDYMSASGTANEAVDYNPVVGTLQFSPGETTQNITLSALDDLLDEQDETFTISLSNPNNGVIGTPNTATVTITDDDLPPLVNFTQVNETIAEGGQKNITVTLNQASGLDTSVDYSLIAGTATSSVDYTPASGTINFAPGETTAEISLTTLQDTLDEVDEDFQVVLSNPVNATLGTSETATVTITDDDLPPLVNFTQVNETIAEGGQKNITVTLSEASGLDTSVDYSLIAGTATSSVDYTPASGTINFAPGETTAEISLTTLQDTLDEVDEDFQVVLSNPVNATLGTSETATVTITDDDLPPEVNFTQVNETIAEGGQKNITVTLSEASGLDTSVDYSLIAGTATASVDYNPASGTINFAPGETTAEISLTTLQDTLDEVDEDFQVVLSNPVNATLGTSETATVTITDDDEPPVDDGQPKIVEFETFRTVFYEDAGEISIGVKLSTTSNQPISVKYSIEDLQTQIGQDYSGASSGTLNFAAGQTNQRINLSIIDDSIVEERLETFRISLSNPTNATIGTNNRFRGDIHDNDAADLPIVEFETFRKVFYEDAGQVSIRVKLNAAFNQPVSVKYRTEDLQTQNGQDYIGASSGTLNFAAGQTSQTINLSIIDDSIHEERLESLRISLSNPTNATIGAEYRFRGDIHDNDNDTLLITNKGQAGSYLIEDYSNTGDYPYTSIDILENDSLLQIQGNAWVQSQVATSITGSSVLNFEFRSNGLGEVQGIGFDTDNIFDSGVANTMFNLQGTENFGIEDYQYTGNGNWQQFSIPIGTYFTGNFNHLVFANEYDGVTNPDASASFRNISIT